MILRVWGRERKLQEMQYRAETLFFVSHPSSTVIFFLHSISSITSILTRFWLNGWLIIDSILTQFWIYVHSIFLYVSIFFQGKNKINFWSLAIKEFFEDKIIKVFIDIFHIIWSFWSLMETNAEFLCVIVKKLFKIFPLLAMTSWHLSILLQVNITNKFHKPISQKELLGRSRRLRALYTVS